MWHNFNVQEFWVVLHDKVRLSSILTDWMSKIHTLNHFYAQTFESSVIAVGKLILTSRKNTENYIENYRPYSKFINQKFL